MANNIIDSIKLSGTTYQIQGEVTVDTALDSGSTNPVQNQALYDELRIPKNEEVETVLEWENNDGGATTNYPTGASKLEFYVDENEMTEGYFIFQDDGYNELGKIFIEISNGNISVTDYENVTYTISGDVVTVNYSSIAASVALIFSSYDCNWTVKAYTGGIVYEPLIDQVSANTTALNALNDKITPTVELTQAQYDALVTAGTVSADTYYIITDAYSPDISSITTAVTSGSTDSEIPTAKAVYDAIPTVTNTITSGSTDAISSGAVYDALGDVETLLSQI